MDLKEFTSPLPKPWLVINAASVHTGPGGGGAASTTVYSQIAANSASNYTGNRSISGNAAATGSLTIPPLPVGAVIRMRANIGYNLTSGSSNLFLFLNGASIAQVQFTPPTVFAGSGRVEANLTILSGGLCKPTLHVFATDLGLSSDDPVATGTPAYNNAINQTLDFQIGFGTANINNNFSCGQFYVELLNAN